ncbi:hypothetical protein LTS18_014409 [Coniosporium uncinatum]|uniref:Uncharacterized protein n=1 Tax=Coniosporium uncinatum TaxID=93489 RepID=A0ACC3CVT2_9PEZI|nr:hypothetical protein LTS18_014409 [Coniosporium uncinatum]
MVKNRTSGTSSNDNSNNNSATRTHVASHDSTGSEEMRSIMMMGTSPQQQQQQQQSHNTSIGETAAAGPGAGAGRGRTSMFKLSHKSLIHNLLDRHAQKRGLDHYGHTDPEIGPSDIERAQLPPVYGGKHQYRHHRHWSNSQGGGGAAAAHVPPRRTWRDMDIYGVADVEALEGERWDPKARGVRAPEQAYMLSGKREEAEGRDHGEEEEGEEEEEEEEQEAEQEMGMEFLTGPEWAAPITDGGMRQPDEERALGGRR